MRLAGALRYKPLPVSLLDDLRQAAASIDPQFQPTSNELPGVVAALIAHTEHGDSFLEAAGQGPEQTSQLLAGGADDAGAEEGTEQAPDDSQTSEGAGPTVTGPTGPVDPEQEDKEAAKASRRATRQQTQVEHEPGATGAKS